eukprot:3234712-Rhodomonas_salina.1
MLPLSSCPDSGKARVAGKQPALAVHRGYRPHHLARPPRLPARYCAAWVSGRSSLCCHLAHLAHLSSPRPFPALCDALWHLAAHRLQQPPRLP